MFPRWLPLYLVGLAALTLFPFTSPACPSSDWATRVSAVDFAANLLAFIPIGFALHRSPLARALLLAFALSLAIELSQQWLPRQPDTADLVSNTLGAAIGRGAGEAWMARWPGALLRPVTWRLAVWSIAPALLVAACLGSLLGPAHDFSTWAPFPFVIGNSAQGNRPWLGEISELSIYDRPLAGGEAGPRLPENDRPALWVDGGPILWVGFGSRSGEGPPPARVDGPSGPVRPPILIGDSTFLGGSGLTLAASGLQLESWISNHVTDRLRETGQMTLDVRLRSGSLYQYGPARIVELGDGHRFRNFVLAQKGKDLMAMIRTPANGRGGATSPIESTSEVVSGGEQSVRLTYDGSHGLLWVDGVCEAVSYMALGLAPAIVGPFLGFTIVASTSLATLGLAWLLPNRRGRLALGLVGGCAAWLILFGVGAWDEFPHFTQPALVLGALSLATTLPLLRAPR